MVAAENYPFCTIEPNVGIVPVPDPRLEELARVSKSAKIVSGTVEFVDIAGLARGAHKGEGLGNQFLSHIRGVDAIVQVVRAFENQEVHHVEGEIDPKRDIETIGVELAMSDLELVAKRIHDLEKQMRSGSVEASAKLEILEKIKAILDQGKPARTANLSSEELILIKDLNLLTLKQTLFVFNIADTKDPSKYAFYKDIVSPFPALFLNIQTEAELRGVDDAELAEYLKEFNLDDTGLNKLIRASYDLLELVTFFTSGEKETKAWTVTEKTCAQAAAGSIHSDIERGFIRAEVVNWKDFVDVCGWTGAKEK